MQCCGGELPCSPSQACCGGGLFCDGSDQCVCFPASATVLAADGRRLTMAQLRSGDRVLSVGWDGRPRFEEVYFWNHRNPESTGSFATVQVAAPGGGSTPAATHTLQLSYTHYMPAGQDASGACAALAAATGSEGGVEPVHQSAWTLAAQVGFGVRWWLSWAARHHLHMFQAQLCSQPASASMPPTLHAFAHGDACSWLTCMQSPRAFSCRS
jgi:hypothetical protein